MLLNVITLFQKMADYAEVFRKPENQNWVKCWIALRIVSQPLLEFCKIEIGKFHTTITSRLPFGRACHKHRHSGSCCYLGQFVSEIEKEHTSKIAWHNTNIRAWRTDAWEVAKCYIHGSGYTYKTAKETDLNGIISIIYNNKLLGNLFSFPSLQDVCNKVCKYF